MSDLFPDERKRARQSMLQVLAASLIVAVGTAYLVARLAGLLPEAPQEGGLGTPLTARPFFAQLPPLASVLKPLPVPVETTKDTLSPTLNSDQTLVAQQNDGRTLLSIGAYLKLVEQVETDKRALLLHLMARAPQLRAALTVNKAGGTMPPVDPDLPLNLPAPINDIDLSGTEAWNRLIDNFEQQTPPTACAELHVSYTAYLKALRDCISACLQPGKYDGSGEQGAGGPGAPATAQQAKERLAAEANAAESALIGVYAQAGLPKSFTIETSDGR
jgi:hypothetical protein